MLVSIEGRTRVSLVSSSRGDASEPRFEQGSSGMAGDAGARAPDLRRQCNGDEFAIGLRNFDLEPRRKKGARGTLQIAFIEQALKAVFSTLGCEYWCEWIGREL